jgi:UDP-glucuronate decarboxylase
MYERPFMGCDSVTSLYLEARAWLEEDWVRVEESLGDKGARFFGKHILITGAAGFLGFAFLHFFSYLNGKQLERNRVRLSAADNFLLGHPRWLTELAASDADVRVVVHDIAQPWPESQVRFDFILHCASVASPKFYRRYPLETLDTNISGLRHMLELARRSGSESLLYLSSSEIYGDPPPAAIPTPETYRGNVGCIGPRACYDESKRLGETLCYLYAQQYGVPAKIVRPFNNYGPGLRLRDGRVIPDLCRDVLADRDLVLHSDGSPTRTFCYVSDALAGYLLVLLSSRHAEPFNIGTEYPEISVRDLAALLLNIAGSRRKVVHRPSDEADYLTDSPNRRCPDITRARSQIGYKPLVGLETGLGRTLEWYRRFQSLEEQVDRRPITKQT